MNTTEILESIKLEKLITPEVDKIIEEYNLTTPEGIKSALRQAMWVGMCHAKGWIENE